MAETWRATSKALRREQYLTVAARLFAARGFSGVSVEELGTAAGVSGPALYRHFPGKDAILSELLVSASERLLGGCETVLAQTQDPRDALRQLIAFHVDFAMSERDVIRIQDRELPWLAADDSRTVRSLQRRYVEAWVGVIGRLRPDVSKAEMEVRTHAVFGLLNSTPYTARLDDVPAARQLLEEMAYTALVGQVHSERAVEPH